MPSTFTTVGFPGSSSTEILSISSVGTMAGYYTDGSGVHGLWYDGHTFSTQDAGAGTILTYAGSSYEAGGLGGFACLNPGSGSSIGWIAGYSFDYVSYPGSSSTMVFGGNENGLVVGWFTDSQNHVHGFSDDLGGFSTIDPNGAMKSYVTGINNNNVMVGLWVTSDGHQHGYSLSSGYNMIDVPGATSTIARGIDDAGAIVGGYQDAAGGRHGFELIGSTFETIDFPGAKATTAYGVLGDTVVGSYVDASNHTHGFMMTGTTSSPAGSLAVSGFPTSTTAGMPGTFTVTVYNTNGTIDTGYAGTVLFSSSDGQAVLPANYSFAAADGGVHTFSATLNTAGTQSITVTDTAASFRAGSQTGITVNPAAASALTVTGFPSPITAGVAHNFTVTLRDPYGNIATSYTGTVQFTSSDQKAALSANYTFTTSDAGAHTFSATLKTAGTQSITAADTATRSLTGMEAGITVNPAAASRFVISAPSSVSAGVACNLTLTVEDAYGNVVIGYTGTVHFSCTDKTATLPKNYTFTAAEKGVHTFTVLVLRKKGYQTITITDTLNNSLTGSEILDVL